MSAAHQLAEHISGLERKIEQLDRRVNNQFREAKVLEVDTERALVKVKAADLDSAWMPWVTRSGKIREWNPPSVGERVILASISGEPGQGVVFPGGYSTEFEKPHDKGDESVVRVGSASILVKDGEIEIKVGDKRVVITGGEIVTHGKTRLNNGNLKIHRVTDMDSGGDAAVGGADEVFA